MSTPKTVSLKDTAETPDSEMESREWRQQGDGSSAMLTAKVRREITSLEELLTFFEVDQEQWEVERFLCNQWQMGSKNKETSVLTVTPLYQVKAWFKRRADYLSAKSDISALVADARSVMRKIPKLPAVKRTRKKKPFLFVPSIMDPHFGKLCWGRETGWENYDVEEASKLVMAAVADLIDQAERYPIGEILFPVGNDFFHVDNGRNMTTAGTPQDVDGRWFRAYRAGRRVIMEAIRALREIAPVRVKIVPGNHDEERIFTLGDALDVAFEKVSGITVDTEPTTRKYHRFGKCLLGFDHGKVPLVRLAGIMQTEARMDWGETKWNEWLIGHWHKKGESVFLPVQEEHGIRVRTIPSLTPPDFWHASSGYVGAVRAAEGLLYHEELGYRAQFSYTPDRPVN